MIRSLFTSKVCFLALTCLLTPLLASPLFGQDPSVSINWDHIIKESKTTPTLQVVVNPMLKRGSPIHDGSFQALKNLGADYVRFVPWFPYPHAAVTPGVNNPEYFKYFLNPKNHKEGGPIDGISYHFYAHRSPQDNSIADWQYSFFEQADDFLVKVKYIENIRKRLSDLNELGVILEGQTGDNIED